MPNLPYHHPSAYSHPTRRSVLVTAGSLILAGQVPAVRAEPPASPRTRKRVLRLAHLTDVHLQPELGAGEGLAKCLQHVHNQPDRPELILNGGDAVMDSNATDEARTKLQWELWQHTWRKHCKLPIEHCLGNHDFWGLDRAASKTSGNEPRWGKKWALEMHGLQRPYHSFDRAGWHFIALDSMFAGDQGGYHARLDDEQFEWLSADLKKTDPKMPVLVLSHMPLVAATGFFTRDPEKSGDWTMPGSMTHQDIHRIKDLFKAHPNVKLCVSGHLHTVDRVDYLGVSYLCNGAVSGAWWKGKNHEFDAGYALVDLFDDGSFEHRYELYGWEAQKA